MICRNGQEGGAIQRVRPCREDRDRGAAIRRGTSEAEIDFRTLGPADPVLLHEPHPVRPAFQPVNGLQKIIGIFCDFQEPLRQQAPFDHRARPPAAAIDNLFVCQNGVLDRIPVDPAFLAVGQAFIQEPQEHALFMLIVVRRAGSQLAVPVIGQPHAAQLCPHGGDVLDGPFAWMDAALHRGVFSRKAEGVPSHGMKNIEAAGPPVTRDNVAKRIVADMSHMNPPGRVGKHFQDIIFGFFAAGVGGETTFGFPPLLPFCLDGRGVVLIHDCHPERREV